MSDGDDSYVTVDEIAEKFRVSKMTIYRLIQSGELAGIRVGRNFRVHLDSVREYVQRSALNSQNKYVERKAPPHESG